MKVVVLVTLVLTVTLASALAFPLTFSEEPKRAGFGVSDYKLNTNMTVDMWQEYYVARIYNTGDFNLSVTVTWVPDDIETENGLTVLTPEQPLFLKVESSQKVSVRVHAIGTGEYSGIVDLDCNPHYPTGWGNPTKPGGSAHVNITVLDGDGKLPIEDGDGFKVDGWQILAVIFVGLFAATLLVTIKKRKDKKT